jgi:metal-responsive CopG/Arc/MetJ family transcriptional regulator
MEAISLKLPASLLEESRRNAQALKMSRSEYMRRAIERMNRVARAELRAKRIAAASRRVRAESMKVNAEFAAVERDPDA